MGGYWCLPEATVSSPFIYQLSGRDQKKKGARMRRVGDGRIPGRRLGNYRLSTSVAA